MSLHVAEKLKEKNNDSLSLMKSESETCVSINVPLMDRKQADPCNYADKETPAGKWKEGVPRSFPFTFTMH